MARTENVELTVLCLIQDGDKILLQNRVKEDWKGYTLPGGHVEIGESFVDAVKREMKEETGLDVTNPKLVGVKQFPIKNGRYIVFLFKTEQFSGELVSSEEGQMEWIDGRHLSEINTVNDFDELLRVINNADFNRVSIFGRRGYLECFNKVKLSRGGTSQWFLRKKSSN